MALSLQKPQKVFLTVGLDFHSFATIQHKTVRFIPKIHLPQPKGKCHLVRRHWKGVSRTLRIKEKSTEFVS